MTEFHEGQEVEVAYAMKWRKAKIFGELNGTMWMVQFPDGTRATFDADHIRLTPQARAQAFYKPIRPIEPKGILSMTDPMGRPIFTVPKDFD